MLKIAFLLVIFINMIVAQEFYVNPYYLEKLKKDTNSYNIINHYVNFLNSIKDEDDKSKIKKVNLYINKIVPRYDSYNYKSEEYWATPFEFFSNAGGDCEDYVIAKMYSLKILGISSKIMYMSTVKEKYSGGDHMVLSLRVDKNKPPLVLDNLSFRVLPMDKRVDLDLIFMFNKDRFYKLRNYKKLIEINKIHIPAYDRLKKKNRNSLILKR